MFSEETKNKLVGYGAIIGGVFILLLAGVISSVMGSCDERSEPTADNKEHWKSVDESIAYKDDEEPTVDEEPDVEIPEYSVIEEMESDRISKTSIRVRLKERVDSKEQLVAVGEEVKNDLAADVEKVFITHWLPGQTPGDEAAYGTTHWNPELSVNLMGSTREAYEQREEERAQKGAQRNVLGRWDSSNPVIDGYLYFAKKGDRYLETQMADGSALTEKVSVQEKSGRTILRPVEGGRDYFVIEESGDLGVYDDQGHIRTGKKTD